MLNTKVMLACGLAAALATSTIATVRAEEFPSRPITFIVPWGPGGGADQLARISAKLMEPRLKVSVPVVNMPGSTGQNGLVKLLSSPADGYTIEVMTGDTFDLFALANSRFKLDQIIPLAVMIQQPSGFFVNAAGPMKTWDDVLKAAKEHELRVAVTGYASPDDLTVRYLKSKGVNIFGVPFPEPGLRYASVVGGQSDILYEQAGDVRSFLDGNQIKPVMFFSKKPAEGFADVPYSQIGGYNVFLPQFRAVIVRAGTDPAIVKRLSEALREVASSDEFKSYLKQQYALSDSFVPSDHAIGFMTEWLSEAKELMSTVAADAPAAKQN